MLHLTSTSDKLYAVTSAACTVAAGSAGGAISTDSQPVVYTVSVSADSTVAGVGAETRLARVGGEQTLGRALAEARVVRVAMESRTVEVMA